MSHPIILFGEIQQRTFIPYRILIIFLESDCKRNCFLRSDAAEISPQRVDFDDVIEIDSQAEDDYVYPKEDLNDLETFSAEVRQTFWIPEKQNHTTPVNLLGSSEAFRLHG